MNITFSTQFRHALGKCYTRRTTQVSAVTYLVADASHEAAKDGRGDKLSDFGRPSDAKHKEYGAEDQRDHDKLSEYGRKQRLGVGTLM